MALGWVAAILFVAGGGAAPTVVVAPPTLLTPPTLLPTGSSTSRVTAESCEALVDSPEYSLQCSSWLGFGFCQNPDFTIFMRTHCPKMCCLAKVPTHASQPTKSPLPPANPLLVQPTPTPNLATESEGPCRYVQTEICKLLSYENLGSISHSLRTQPATRFLTV